MYHCFMIASFKGFIELIYAAFNGLLSNIKADEMLLGALKTFLSFYMNYSNGKVIL